MPPWNLRSGPKQRKWGRRRFFDPAPLEPDWHVAVSEFVRAGHTDDERPPPNPSTAAFRPQRPWTAAAPSLALNAGSDVATTCPTGQVSAAEGVLGG